MGNYSEIIQNKLKETYSIEISRKRICLFVKEYNEFQMPLTERLKSISEDIEPLYEFMLERTDIPLYPEQNNYASKHNSK